MLRILGIHGSPGTRLLIGAAMLGVGLWRHTTIAVVVGVALVAWTAVSALTGRRERQPR
jgi:hypothetical protein